MYVLTGKGEVTGFAVDRVEKYGIQHLCNVYLPEKTSCWTFTEDEYTEMGEPDLRALEPDGKADFITVGKEAWEAQNVELFKSDKETWQHLYPELFIEETEHGSESEPEEISGDRTPEETGEGDGEIVYPELFIEETEHGSEDKPEEISGDRTPEETGNGDGETVGDRSPVIETTESTTSRDSDAG